MKPTIDRGRERLLAYRRRRADDRAWTAVGGPSYRAPRRLTNLPGPDRRLRLNRRSRDPISLEGRILTVMVVAVGLFLLWWGWKATRVDVNLTGLSVEALHPDDTDELAFRIDVSPGGRLDEATLTFNGRDVLPRAEVSGDVIAWKPGALEEGDYTLRLTVPRPILSDAAMTWSFTVDGTPPRITAPPYLAPHDRNDPVKVEGKVEGATTVFVDGEETDVDGDGDFTLEYEKPPPGPIELRAVDPAGNERAANVYVPLEFPETVHGVHVTAIAWDNDRLRSGIIDLIDAGVIDTVVLTLKDEGGLVGHRTNVPTARRIGSSQNLYDLEDVVDFLHGKGVRVTGRIVAFRDPVLAEWAWEHGHREMVIQNQERGRFELYGGGFTNFSSSDVQRYNIELATEAVKAGVDDILYDYVRRPDGFLEDMVIPGLEGEPEDAVEAFLSTSHERLRALGAIQGASVFGVAATRPEQIAQNILDMAGHTDYIAPMLYPSHWNVGEYGIPDPEQEPYEIVKRAMRDFRQQVARTGRPLIPWIQHFSLDVRYTTADVVAQVEAAKEMGAVGWMMWDPDVTYDPKALDLSGS